jgi:hypothetical protein
MIRINDLSKKKEEQKLVIDKESSARLIKRSLWQGVQRRENKEEDIKRQKIN